MKEIKYQQVGDYEFPVLKGSPSLPQLSRFGMIYLQHLKENEKGHYFALMVENKLNDELIAMDRQMNEQYDLLVKQFQICWNIDEKLKEENQMKWVGLMNYISSEAFRMVINEFLYK